MKTYTGYRDPQGKAHVFVIDHDHETIVLEPGFRYVQHSACGFAWGYAGAGPAQLAFAILLDHFEEPDRARVLYQSFMHAMIVDLPMDEQWEITSEDIAKIYNTSGAQLHIREARCRDIT